MMSWQDSYCGCKLSGGGRFFLCDRGRPAEDEDKDAVDEAGGAPGGATTGQEAYMVASPPEPGYRFRRMVCNTPNIAVTVTAASCC